MTKEEKAKAYDEAIERARTIVENKDASSVWKDWLHNTFPELKEPEDEKIRKEIKQLIQCMHDADPRKERWITWLEKQGEQKPFDYENANIQQKDFAPQKDTPRYSIGDVLCDKSCTTLNKESQPNLEILDIKNGTYICDKGSFPVSQQDEYELVAKRIEKKPQRMVSAEAKEDLYNNPAWSEDDEEFLSEIISDIKFAQDKHPDSQMNQIIFEEEVTWLKSLKERIKR